MGFTGAIVGREICIIIMGNLIFSLGNTVWYFHSQSSTKRGVIGMKSKDKVLVIDDDIDFGVALTYFFTGKPFELFLATTMHEGMSILASERPDHIFLDNGLPDGMGWESAKAIMALYPASRLNLISALRMRKPSELVHCILIKPIRLQDLMGCLN